MREGTAVDGYTVEPDRVTVRTGDGREAEASFLIDATGRASFTGVREGLREMHPRHRKIAVFGHFRGVPLPDGDRQGGIFIVRLENEWAWLIPPSPDKVSVGLVPGQAALRESGLTPEAMLARLADSSAVMRAKLGGAEQLGPLRAAGFSDEALALTSQVLAHWRTWSGIGWNSFTLPALLPSLGTGSDYFIYVILELQGHGSLVRMRARLVRPLLVGVGASVCGFGSLAWAGNLGLSSLGRVCALALALNVLVALFLMPWVWRLARRVLRK